VLLGNQWLLTNGYQRDISNLSGLSQTDKTVVSRRQEVLEAARELFFERGYRGTTIQEIAARAGYSKRTVYLDFLNKDELFIAVCAEGGELILGDLERVRDADPPLVEAVDRMLETFVAFSREHDGYFRMIFSEATPEIVANCSPALRAQVAELERACLQVLVGCVERAVAEGLIGPVDPWDVAGILVGTATGIILLSMGGSQTVYSLKTREVLVRQAVHAYWLGLRVQGAAP
jgi:AcrR family transcriptional regulator